MVPDFLDILGAATGKYLWRHISAVNIPSSFLSNNEIEIEIEIKIKIKITTLSVSRRLFGRMGQRLAAPGSGGSAVG